MPFREKCSIRCVIGTPITRSPPVCCRDQLPRVPWCCPTAQNSRWLRQFHVPLALPHSFPGNSASLAWTAISKHSSHKHWLQECTWKVLIQPVSSFCYVPPTSHFQLTARRSRQSLLCRGVECKSCLSKSHTSQVLVTSPYQVSRHRNDTPTMAPWFFARTNQIHKAVSARTSHEAAAPFWPVLWGWMNTLHSPSCYMSQSNSTCLHVTHHEKLRPYLYNEFFRLFTSMQTQPTPSAGAVCDHGWHWHTDMDLWCLENNTPPHPKESRGEQGKAPFWMQAPGKKDRSLLIYWKSKEQMLNENLETTSNYKQVPAK